MVHKCFDTKKKIVTCLFTVGGGVRKLNEEASVCPRVSERPVWLIGARLGADFQMRKCISKVWDVPGVV